MLVRILTHFRLRFHLDFNLDFQLHFQLHFWFFLFRVKYLSALKYSLSKTRNFYVIIHLDTTMILWRLYVQLGEKISDKSFSGHLPMFWTINLWQFSFLLIRSKAAFQVETSNLRKESKKKLRIYIVYMYWIFWTQPEFSRKSLSRFAKVWSKRANFSSSEISIFQANSFPVGATYRVLCPISIISGANSAWRMIRFETCS